MIAVVRAERGVVCAAAVLDVVPLGVLLHLPQRDQGAILVGGRPLQRLPRSLLLRAMRAVPGVPRAQEP